MISSVTWSSVVSHHHPTALLPSSCTSSSTARPSPSPRHPSAKCEAATSHSHHSDYTRDHHTGDHQPPTPQGVSPLVPALPPLPAQYPHLRPPSPDAPMIDVPIAHAPILPPTVVLPPPRFSHSPPALSPPRSLHSTSPRKPTCRRRCRQFRLQNRELFLVRFFVLQVRENGGSHRHQIIDARLRQLRLFCAVGAFQSLNGRSCE